MPRRPENCVNRSDLATLLGLSVPALRSLLTSGDVRPARGGRDPLFRWDDVNRVLKPAELKRIRKVVRERGFNIKSSTWTLAGYPELVKEFHRTKNGELTPWHVSYGSKKNIWWKCSEGPDHEWQAAPNSRTKPRGSGCPCCAGRKLSVTNSLAILAADVAKELHPKKNAKLTADQLLAGSMARVWWKCPRGPDHEWQAMVHTRAKADRGCPFCAGRRLSVTNSLKTRFPNVAREWHPENAPLTPARVQYGSKRKVWWRCPKGHEWQATPNTRTSGNGCPACSGHLATSTTSLAGVAPLVAAQWDHRRNRGVTPGAVTAGAMTKYWWRCPVARDHVWQATVASRVRGKSGCPACWGNLVTKSNCLATTRPDIAASWHPTRNRALTPRDVTPGSGRQVWWKCPVARDHVWRTSVGNRTVGDGRGCPFCANRLASTTNSLKSRHPKLARGFDEKRNGVSPREVVATSRKKYWWRCSKVKSHRWEAAPVRRTQDESGCPHCSVRVRPHSRSLVFREWL